MVEEAENYRRSARTRGDSRKEGDWNGWDDNEEKPWCSREEKEKSDRDDSPRTLNIHL